MVRCTFLTYFQGENSVCVCVCVYILYVYVKATTTSGSSGGLGERPHQGHNVTNQKQSRCTMNGQLREIPQIPNIVHHATAFSSTHSIQQYPSSISNSCLMLSESACINTSGHYSHAVSLERTLPHLIPTSCVKGSSLSVLLRRYTQSGSRTGSAPTV